MALPFASPYCGPAFLPPPPAPLNLSIVAPPPPLPPEPAQPATADASDDAMNSTSGGVETFHFSQLPAPTPVVLDEYPALVTFRNGGIYSVAKHWVKNQKFYFVTPQGETLYVPVGQVDRIYPPVKSAETHP